MDASRLFSTIVGGFFLVWAVFVLIFGDDRYLKWHFWSIEESGYDKKRAKNILLLALTIMGLWGVFGGVMGKMKTPFLILLLILFFIFLFSLTRKETNHQVPDISKRGYGLEAFSGAMIGSSGYLLTVGILDKEHHSMEFWIIMAMLFVAGILGAILLLKKNSENELRIRWNRVRTFESAFFAGLTGLLLVDIFEQKHHSLVTWIILVSISVLLYLGPRLFIKNKEKD